jgi:hypothetical protein
MKRLTIISSLVLLLIMTPACTVQPYAIYDYKEEEQVKSKLTEIRKQWNAQDFETIYESGASSFRVEGRKAELVAAMKQAFNQYGEFDEVVDEKFKVIPPLPLQVRVSFHSKFRKTKVSERFTFVKIDDDYKLGGYTIDLNDVALDELLSNKY